MAKQLLRHHVSLLLGVALWGVSTLTVPFQATAEVPLTRAVVQSLRNRVRLLIKNQSPRPARVQDAMTPGDAVSTAQASRAELRFNDGSLARVGEQALFQFLPNTRTFRLNNGTVLLLIPQGRGQTRLQTPNVVTGIRGSALFVRYAPDTDTTTVGALTTSGIEVTNRDGTQRQPLQAGQIAVVVQDRITRVYNFDLRTFYETSDLVQGLGLARREAGVAIDADLASVQAETVDGVAAQQAPNAPNTLQAENLLTIPTEERSPTLTPLDRSFLDLAQLSLLTVTQPLLFLPETVSQPGRQFEVRPFPPGESGPFSGNGGLVPGLNGSNPPGQVRVPPGINVTPPNLSGPPGQTGTAPGLAGTAPGRGGSGPPGQTGTAPGLAGTTPGQGGSGPPGQTGAAPGQSGANPGRGGR